MQRNLKRAAAAAAILSTIAMPAFAHVTLQVREAAVGSGYRAVLQVSHGCGSEATTAIRVSIPDGFTDAKPMPKAGWDLATATADDGKVTEITWSGGELPSEWYDEFVFRGSFSGDLEVGSLFRFPLIQQCTNSEERWISDDDAAENPAPGLTLIESTGGGHAH